MTDEWQLIKTTDGKERILATVSLAYLDTLSDYERRRFWRMFWHKFSLAGRRDKSALSSSPPIIEGQDAEEFVKTLATPPLEQRNPKLTQEARRVFRTHGLPTARDGGDKT